MFTRLCEKYHPALTPRKKRPEFDSTHALYACRTRCRFLGNSPEPELQLVTIPALRAGGGRIENLAMKGVGCFFLTPFSSVLLFIVYEWR